MKTLHIAIEQKSCQQICQTLASILADTYVLYTKTQNFHWNIVDPRFASLHKFLEEQYEKLAEAVDELAERIRILGEKAPGSLKQFLELTSLDENTTNGNLSGDQMLKDLLKDHETAIRHMRTAIRQASQAGDEGTADLLIDNLRFHEKTVWMIRSHFAT